jgi:hypothetical protein
MSTFTIPSATDETKSYTVTLGPRSTACTCPDWTNRRGPGCPQEGTDCKHVRQARAEQYRGYELIAGSLEDSELTRLIAKYQAQPGPVLVALLAEQLDRSQLDRMPAPPPVFHLLDAVLVRARAWGQARRQRVPLSGLSEAQRKAIWA